MENFDDIPDENTMDMMNRAYARARVRSGAAENTAANVLPAHCKESARECVRRFTRVNACVRAFFERSARGRGLLRELLPMSENLLARAFLRSCRLRQRRGEYSARKRRRVPQNADGKSERGDNPSVQTVRIFRRGARPYRGRARLSLSRVGDIKHFRQNSAKYPLFRLAFTQFYPPDMIPSFRYGK